MSLLCSLINLKSNDWSVMPKTHCAWCSKESQIADTLNGFDSTDRYLCSNCLIDILPKTIVKMGYQQESNQERRIHERHPLVSDVYLSTQKKKNLITKILLLDISNTGMKIQLKENLNQDEEITLGFLDEEVVYKYICKVRHISGESSEGSDSYQAGIEITGIHQDKRIR